MREILFRGKRMRDGTWIYGQVFTAHNIEHDDEKETYLVWNDAYCNTTKGTVDFSEVDPDTVGQFAGLLDKNRNKIFEGDILKDKFSHIWLVTYERGAFCITNGHISGTLFEPYAEDEVIGNKWDNPELLNP